MHGDDPEPEPEPGQASLPPLIVTHAYFRGPLPPPNVLEQFERAHPGAAERIFVMAEDQQRNRHKLEELALVGALRAEAAGQWLAAFVVSLAIVAGAWLAYSGHDATGLATILTPLAAVAAAFLHSRNVQAHEREQKRAELERARMGTPA